MDLLEKLWGRTGPYISKLLYDLDEREVVVILYDKKGFKFTEVQELTECHFEDSQDTNYTDSIMGLHMIDEGKYCLNTEKRELIITTNKAPISYQEDA